VVAADHRCHLLQPEATVQADPPQVLADRSRLLGISRSTFRPRRQTWQLVHASLGLCASFISILGEGGRWGGGRPRGQAGEGELDLVLSDRHRLDDGLDDRPPFRERDLEPAGREVFRGGDDFFRKMRSRSAWGILVRQPFRVQTYFGVLGGTYIFAPQWQKVSPPKSCTGRFAAGPAAPTPSRSRSATELPPDGSNRDARHACEGKKNGRRNNPCMSACGPSARVLSQPTRPPAGADGHVKVNGKRLTSMRYLAVTSRRPPLVSLVSASDACRSEPRLRRRGHERVPLLQSLR
jgi:hypothetical protein